MDRKPILPCIAHRARTNRQEAIGGETGYPDSGNSFIANSFVVFTAGALAAVATDGVLACGFVLDDSKSSTEINPPEAFFGDRHYPLNLEGMRFAITVFDDAENIGEANGAPQLSEVTVGSEYGILLDSDGIHRLNVDETANTLFRVVEKPSVWDGVAQDANTYNPVVIAEVIASKIQSLG